MGFREVSVVEVREVLRAWLAGAGLRTVAERAGVDCKTTRRYVAAAEVAGVCREGGLGQLTDEVIGQVVGAVRPVRAGRSDSGRGGRVGMAGSPRRHAARPRGVQVRGQLITQPPLPTTGALTAARALAGLILCLGSIVDHD
ncbi:MAG: hypothetical protein ACRDRU_23250 [Pseudonocardiaceae bacterium]